MALQRTSLTKVVQLTGAATAVYSLPAGSRAFVRGILLHNTSDAEEHVDVHWVQPSGSAAAANRIVSVDLQPDETLTAEVPFSLVLTEEREAIVAGATTASVVNICVFGDLDQ